MADTFIGFNDFIQIIQTRRLYKQMTRMKGLREEPHPAAEFVKKRFLESGDTEQALNGNRKPWWRKFHRLKKFKIVVRESENAKKTRRREKIIITTRT